MEWTKINEQLPIIENNYSYFFGFSKALNKLDFIYFCKERNCFWDEERNKPLKGFDYWQPLPKAPK